MRANAPRRRPPNTEGATMRVAATPLRWLVLAFVVYLFYKSPQAMSNILGDLGRLFVAIGNGLETAIDKVPAGHATHTSAHHAAGAVFTPIRLP